MAHHATEKYPFDQIFSRNPPVREVSSVTLPRVSSRTVVGASAFLVGDVQVDDDVFIGFHSVLRADSGYPFYIGPKCNIQDFVLMHCHPGQGLEVKGRKMGVVLERNVSVLHHAAVHGPLYIGENTFIGQHANIYMATIGSNCVVMHGATITEHVKIADGRFVAPGQTVATQAVADALPEVPPEHKGLNAEIVDHYYRLGKSYLLHTPLFISGRGRPGETYANP